MSVWGREWTCGIGVAVADHLAGPYLNKKGEVMMKNNHEILIHSNERFMGTGLNAEIVSDKKGQDWILYMPCNR